LIDWHHEKSEFLIKEDICLICLEGHPVKILYHKLCYETGLDGGEPYTFNVALLLTDNKEEDISIYPNSSHWSLSSMILNLLTMIYGGTLGHCRIIGSKDSFDTCWGTYELYEPLSEGVYELQASGTKLGSYELNLMQTICTNLKATTATNSKHTRINNALTFFYLAWNVHTFEQTIIGLSIVMETMFSPGSNSELSHQVSYNIAKFACLTKNERQEKYKAIKKYYSIRSKIVHGEPINTEEYDSIPILFKFISSVLLKILSDKTLIIIFNDNKLRRQYLDDLIFN